MTRRFFRLKITEAECDPSNLKKGDLFTVEGDSSLYLVKDQGNCIPVALTEIINHELNISIKGADDERK